MKLTLAQLKKLCELTDIFVFDKDNEELVSYVDEKNNLVYDTAFVESYNSKMDFMIYQSEGAHKHLSELDTIGAYRLLYNYNTAMDVFFGTYPKTANLLFDTNKAELTYVVTPNYYKNINKFIETVETSTLFKLNKLERLPDLS